MQTCAAITGTSSFDCGIKKDIIFVHYTNRITDTVLTLMEMAQESFKIKQNYFIQ